MSTASDLDMVVDLKADDGTTTDALGKAVEDWQVYGRSVRAKVSQQSGREFMATPGLQSQRKVTFRIRWRSDVTVKHRVTYGGVEHDVVEVREIGRRRWLDLFTVAAG